MYKLMFTLLENYKKYPYKIIEKYDDDCSICLDKTINNVNWIKLSCNHVFHEKCMQTYLKIKKVCPLCRFEL